jgi:hypothetical protein
VVGRDVSGGDEREETGEVGANGPVGSEHDAASSEELVASA